MAAQKDKEEMQIRKLKETSQMLSIFAHSTM